MKAIKVMATIDEDGQLTLDYPLLKDKNARVEVIVLISEEVEIDGSDKSKQEIKEDFYQAWHEAMTGQTISVAQVWEGICYS
jgi:hypothetical protein